MNKNYPSYGLLKASPRLIGMTSLIGMTTSTVRLKKLRAESVHIRLDFIGAELDLATTFANMAARKKQDGRREDCARLKSEAETALKKVQECMVDKAIPLPIADKRRLRGEVKLLKGFTRTL